MALNDFLTQLRTRAKAVFGDDTMDWVDRSYLTDWIIVGIMMALTTTIEKLPVYERDFSPKDPLINHEKTHQQISGTLNGTIAIVVPLIVVILYGTLRRSLGEIHHGCLATFASRAISDLITEGLKNRVGRLRPDFLSRCKWKAAAAACTGKLDQVKDGRRSFPSGHSSTAWVGMTMVALFLAGKTAAWCFSAPVPARSILGSRMARLVITLAPLSFATWVAVSRVEDYRHHKEDVIVGSLIGVVSSLIIYTMYWPNPFSAASFAPEVKGKARLVYRADDYERQRNGGYELTNMDPNV